MNKIKEFVNSFEDLMQKECAQEYFKALKDSIDHGLGFLSVDMSGALKHVDLDDVFKFKAHLEKLKEE